ncbi:MAG TPA: mechanosensitive ion channel family protein, partial [Acidimicrobiales bacterium]|nr:mechanosensitive ion channel family protein [Acidimicrobiales bacterium]
HVALRWAEDHLLPAVLIGIGAVLLGRLARWVSRRYRAGVDADVHAAVEKGGVVSESAKRTRAVAQVVEWTTVALLYAVAVILVIHVLGVPLTSLVAPATVVGVALGFGAQQIVGDLLSGFFLFAERQFGVGDLITMAVPGSANSVSGTVEEVTLRVTKLRSAQGELIIVPNSALQQVTNLSRDWSRVVIDLPVPISDDLEAVTRTITGVARSMAEEERWRSLIIGDPVVAGVETIEVDHVQLRLVLRTMPGRQFEVGRELRLRLATALREINVSAPTGLAS